jgi:hypothetical protein
VGNQLAPLHSVDGWQNEDFCRVKIERRKESGRAFDCEGRMSNFLSGFLVGFGYLVEAISFFKVGIAAWFFFMSVFIGKFATNPTNTTNQKIEAFS